MRIDLKTKKPVLLVVNKLDNPKDNYAMWEFMQLGLGEPWPVSSLHGTGTGDQYGDFGSIAPLYTYNITV